MVHCASVLKRSSIRALVYLVGGAFCSCPAFADPAEDPWFKSKPKVAGTDVAELGSRVLWQFKPGSARQITVCWERFEPSAEVVREMVRAQVGQTWSAQSSALEFVGWNECAPGSKGVRVLLHPKINPNVATVGRYLDGVENGVQIGFSSSSPWMLKCAGPVGVHSEACFRWQVTHVFGHVLGLLDAGRRDEPFQEMLCRVPPDIPDLAEDAGDPLPPMRSAPKSADATTEQLDRVMARCPGRKAMEGVTIELSLRDVCELERKYPPEGQSPYVTCISESNR